MSAKDRLRNNFTQEKNKRSRDKTGNNAGSNRAQIDREGRVNRDIAQKKRSQKKIPFLAKGENLFSLFITKVNFTLKILDIETH